MNPLASWLGMFLGLLLAVAPVYWLIMPALSTGFGLLSLIFVFSFIFGYLGGRSPALKSGPMIMFVVGTGISNQQSYSFQGLVDAALMLLLAGAIVTVGWFQRYCSVFLARCRSFQSITPWLSWRDCSLPQLLEGEEFSITQVSHHICRFLCCW